MRPVDSLRDISLTPFNCPEQSSLNISELCSPTYGISGWHSSTHSAMPCNAQELHMQHLTVNWAMASTATQHSSFCGQLSHGTTLTRLGKDHGLDFGCGRRALEEFPWPRSHLWMWQGAPYHCSSLG